MNEFLWSSWATLGLISGITALAEGELIKGLCGLGAFVFFLVEPEIMRRITRSGRGRYGRML